MRAGKTSRELWNTSLSRWDTHQNARHDVVIGATNRELAAPGGREKKKERGREISGSSFWWIKPPPPLSPIQPRQLRLLVRNLRWWRVIYLTRTLIVSDRQWASQEAACGACTHERCPYDVSGKNLTLPHESWRVSSHFLVFVSRENLRRAKIFTRNVQRFF